MDNRNITNITNITNSTNTTNTSPPIFVPPHVATDYILADIGDNNTIATAISRENNQDAIRLANDTSKLQQIMYDINQQVEYDGEFIREAEIVTDNTTEILYDANINIESARYGQAKSLIWYGTIIGGVFGALVGGPIGGYIGGQSHLLVAGSVIGSLTGGGVFGGLFHSAMKSKV